MAGNTVLSFVLRLFSLVTRPFNWIDSIRESISTSLARQRDAKLNAGVPLTDLDLDHVAQGLFGPAAANIVGFSSR
jgi:hypothetical protein